MVRPYQKVRHQTSHEREFINLTGFMRKRTEELQYPPLHRRDEHICCQNRPPPQPPAFF